MDVLVSAAMTEEQYKIFSMLRPKIYKDGDQWCVLYGEDFKIRTIKIRCCNRHD